MDRKELVNTREYQIAKALGLSYPKMQHWLKKYGIVCNHNAKQVEPEPSAPSLPWYKRLFKKGE